MDRNPLKTMNDNSISGVAVYEVAKQSYVTIK